MHRYGILMVCDDHVHHVQALCSSYIVLFQFAIIGLFYVMLISHVPVTLMRLIMYAGC